MPFNLQEWLDRVTVAVGREMTEEEIGVIVEQLSVIAGEAIQDLVKEIAGDPSQGIPGVPSLHHCFETIVRLPIVGGLGVALLLDSSTKYDASDAPITLNILTNSIRTVYYIPDAGTRVKCYRLRTADDLDRPQPAGFVWWYPRDTAIESIDTNGLTRYTGNALAGKFELHCTFIPTVANFPDHEELQPRLVKHMMKYALAKRDDRLAAAITGTP
jgi:hypothetical protein